MILKVKTDANITFSIPENIFASYSSADYLQLQEIAMFHLQSAINIAVPSILINDEGKIDDKVKVTVDFGTLDISTDSKLATQIFLIRSILTKHYEPGRLTADKIEILSKEIEKEITQGNCSWAFK